ncbi:hypothetical protein EYC84_005167 [Monilinia fructicola]|uniref:Uncharacterized protein n=1 Tax=Monilinia fructicola TaxID=38448 RepID=A0A5M9JVN4_MONFR|nr:hypothetical protein EYC84_005167 [Monilinia fructicola]
MAPIVPDEAQCAGKLVALEGNINTITTQLRLLPHSHMLLIIAPLDHYLSEDHQQEAFDARLFVRDVHIALTRRNEVARSFLQSSSQSRLALLNGGSVSARAICVAKISQRLTCGNLAEAERIFHDIVKDGVAGLFENTTSSKSTLLSEPAKETIRPRTKLPKRLDLRSTKSAPTLDGKDQPKQESGTVEEIKMSGAQKSRIRDGSGLQMIDVPEKSWTTTPEPPVWGFQQGDDIVTTVLSIPPQPGTVSQIDDIETRRRPISQYSGTFGPQPPSRAKPSFNVPRSRYSTQQSPDLDGNEDYFEYISQDEENSFFTPQVVYGEACVVDMQSAFSTPMRWTKSVGDLSIGDKASDSNNSKHSASVNDLRESFKVSKKSFIRDSIFERLPKTAFVRASETTIRGFSSSSTPDLGSSIRSRGVHRTLEGCGTGVEEDFDSTKAVFDIAEDMIIHFTDNSPREIVRSISEYRSGTFPIYPSFSPQSLPTPPDTASLVDECFDRGKATTHRDNQQRAEVDRFFSSSSATLEGMKRQRASENVDAATNGFPLTPKSTILAFYSDPTEKFCEFPGAYTNKSIDIQNEFRSFLSSHFVEEATVLNHYQSSLMPECGDFWRDMFSGCSSAFHEEPAIDQIIAVGCEKRISGVLRTQLLRQIESIGVKNNGESRSGRLDLRFLIASAMQTFMSQPLLSRKDLDPMTDPRLLAELIVPHLEQYLVTNSLVRFLVLSFSSDQIATVIALRSLLGSDLVKVAGVLDTLSSDPPSFAKPSPPQFHASNHSCDAALATSRRPDRPQRYPLKSSPDVSSWYEIEQVAVQPSAIPSQAVLMEDASTSANESLPIDYTIDMPQLMAEQDSDRPLSYLYDSEASEIEISSSPTGLFPFPNNHYINSRPVSPPYALVSSSCSLTDSTIRHIPIAIERQSIPQDLASSSDELFPQDQEQQQDQDIEYPSEHGISSSAPAYLNRAHSKIPPGSVDLDLELEAAEDSEDDEYDRMVMGRYSPMGARQRSMVSKNKKKFEAGGQDLETRPMKGNSRKALKWLGLA